MADGVVVVYDRIPIIIKALQEAAKVSVRQVAKEVSDEANASAPYDTGTLAASGYWCASDVSTYGQAVAAAESIAGRDMLEEVDLPTKDDEAIVAYAADYAIFLHDGTAHISARPWLAIAAEGARDRVTTKTAAIISAAISKVAP